MISRIGQYEIQSQIGSGGFGRVYGAYDRQTGRKVAIKILSLGADDRETLARFRAEAVAAGQLHHENILAVYEFGEFQGKPYLVTEFPEGETLQELIHRKVELPLLEKVRLLSQVAGALYYAHQYGVLHRDVKPANIIRFPSGDAKLMNFGAKRAGHSEIAGTIPYLAPELFHRADAAPTSDIFAFGVVSYEFLAGDHPFSGPTYRDVMHAIVSVDPQPLGNRLPGCPKALEELVQRAMAKDPDLRYQSMEDILLALEPVLADSSQQITGDWRIVLAIERERVSDAAIADIVRTLRRLTGDDKLTLRSLERGSVILTLRGSADGYKVLEDLFRSGKLSIVLGLPVEAVSFTGSAEAHAPDSSAASKNHDACRVFCSYSHRDRALREKLDNHLRVLERKGLIQIWHDRKLTGGDDWRGQIDEHLNSANLILVLVSADFLGSDYCYDTEMQRALDRHQRGEARVVPIILRPAPWRESPLAKLQALPDGAKPVTKWSNRDAAFSSIAEGLRDIVLQLQSH